MQDSATYGYLANSSLLSSVTFGSGAATNYSYEPHRNLKTQVANRHNSTLISQYDYTYDAISRRTSMTTTGNLFSDTTATTTATHETDLAQPGQINYISNALNQYTGIDRDGSISSPVYDDDGNMTDDGTRIFTWNGENRLVSAAPKTPVEGDKKAEFVYDYMGRRVKKSLYSYSAASSWQLEKEILFIWDGWNLIRESTVASGVQSIRDFVWGLDLSQSMQGAGGVGGLVAMVDQGNEYLYFYDANGNVGQLLNSSDGAVAAHYEYDPYGNLTRSYGEYAAENPFRFSTKYKDDETGLVYYGYRYYDPEMGRWVSQDPINEQGSLLLRNEVHQDSDLNTYGFVLNNPINLIDRLGLDGGAISIPAGICVEYIIKTLIVYYGTKAVVETIKVCKDDCNEGCPPCKTVSGKIVPVGTMAYRPLDVLPDDVVQHGVAGSHHNIFIAHQNPNNCKCFWKKQKYVLKPEELPPNAIPIELFAN